MQITGLILAGGRGSRMGSIDKGLEPLGDTPICTADGCLFQAGTPGISPRDAQFQGFR